MVISCNISPITTYTAIYVSLDHTTKTYIDHIGSDNKFRRSTEEVEIKIAVDIASNYLPVVTNI